MAVGHCIRVVFLWRLACGARLQELDADNTPAPAPEKQTCANFWCPRGKIKILNAYETPCAEPICDASDESVCCEEEAKTCNRAELTLTNLLVNNLGGKGPNSDETEHTLVFGNVFPELEDQVNLVVSNYSAYVPKKSIRNGLNGIFGVINIKGGKEVGLKFSFVNAATGAPQDVPAFLFSILNLDTNRKGGGREYVKAMGYQAYRTAKITDVVVEPEDDSNGVFRGSTSAYGQENPTDLRTLTDYQMQRLVTFVFPSSSEFKMLFGSTGGQGGRNIFFGGASALYCGTRGYSLNLPGSMKLNDPKYHSQVSGYEQGS